MSIALAEPAAARAAPVVQSGFFDQVESSSHPLGVAVIGTLRRQAEVRISVDGRVHLFVQVVQPREGARFVAMWHRDAAHRPELETLAAQLIPGTSVLLRGHSLKVISLPSGGAIELQHCESVSRIDFTKPVKVNPS